MQNKKEFYTTSRGEQLVNMILIETAKIIKDKYNINPCGAGAAMPGGPIQELTLCFKTYFPYSKNQLRELLIKSAGELIDCVNKNNEIQEFLENRPFTLNDVQIIIYNTDKEGREVYDPGISTSEISQDVLIYQTVDKNDVFNYKNEYREKYEDALKIIQEK